MVPSQVARFSVEVNRVDIGSLWLMTPRLGSAEYVTAARRTQAKPGRVSGLPGRLTALALLEAASGFGEHRPAARSWGAADGQHQRRVCEDMAPDHQRVI